VPDLLAGRGEVDRAGDSRIGHAPTSASSASRVISSPTKAMPFPSSTTGWPEARAADRSVTQAPRPGGASGRPVPDAGNRLALLDQLARLHQPLEEPARRRPHLVEEAAADSRDQLVCPARVVDARRRQPERGARDGLALEDAEVAEDVREAAPREFVHRSGDAAAAAELRGDDRLPLRLRDRREVVVAGGVEEVDVGVPRLHRVQHRPALDGVVDGTHVRARDEQGAVPPECISTIMSTRGRARS
jgi:hypothetical protein